MLEKETYSQLFKWSFSKRHKSHTGMVPSKSMGKGQGDPVFLKIVFNEKNSCEGFTE